MTWQNFKDTMRAGFMVLSLLGGPAFALFGGLALWESVLARDRYQADASTLLVVIATALLWMAMYGLAAGIRYTPRLWRRGMWILFMVLGVYFLHHWLPLAVLLLVWSLYIFWWQDHGR